MKTCPLVLVVGFLGAGKTTLVRDLLPLLEQRGLDPFVIINDYANARVDASSLQKNGRAVTPINGNCICCDSVVELMNVLLEMPLTANRVVVIEANGTSDPTALVEHLLVNAVLRERFDPLVQIAVVDVKRWQKRHWHNELERLQVETASHVVFTREDSEAERRVADVKSDITRLNPKAEPVGREALAELLGDLAARDAEAHAHSCCDHGHHDCDGHHHHHHHHDERHALAHAFVGLQLDLPDEVAAADLRHWLRSLPPDVLRVKGVVHFRERPGTWFQFQRIDDEREEAVLVELPQPPVVPACAVLIGVRLDEVALQRQMRDMLGGPTALNDALVKSA
jgi:G3E family GTPase